MDLDSLIKILHDESLSCVILKKDGGIVKCYRRGIIDLFELLKNSPQTLDGAIIADKVVGRGAAALMALGGVAKLHTDVVSSPALELLQQSGIATSYDVVTDNIINRTGDDICPVEKLTSQVKTAQEALPLIEGFVANMAANNKNK